LESQRTATADCDQMFTPLIYYIRCITNKVLCRACGGYRCVDRAGEVDAIGIVFAIIGR
jgi:hypothetical protein